MVSDPLPLWPACVLKLASVWVSWFLACALSGHPHLAAIHRNYCWFICTLLHNIMGMWPCVLFSAFNYVPGVHRHANICWMSEQMNKSLVPMRWRDTRMHEKDTVPKSMENIAQDVLIKWDHAFQTTERHPGKRNVPASQSSEHSTSFLRNCFLVKWNTPPSTISAAVQTRTF